MQVVLRQDVKGMGIKGDLVKVADGYARNFLFPRGLAEPATRGALKSHHLEREARERREERETQAARDLAERLTGVRVTIRAKMGKGRLFGAVTSKDIVEALAGEHGIDVDKKRIQLGEPVKQTGEREIEVRLHPGVTGRFTLVVEGEEGP